MLPLIIFTAVQVIVESLPISSSAHVMLTQHLLANNTKQLFSQIPDFFNDLLQGPTIIVLSLFFFHDWFWFVQKIPTLFFKYLGKKHLSWAEKKLWGIVCSLALFVCAADAITALAYICKGALFTPAPFWFLALNFTLSMGGLLSLQLIEKKQKYEAAPLTLKKACVLGVTQGLALLCPGLSRFGATYVVGRWMRLTPRRSFQCSFLIQFPLILAAFLAKGIPGLLKNSTALALLTPPMLAILAASTVFAGFLLAWSYRLAIRGKFWRFGLYMIIPITIALLLQFSH